MDKKVCKHLMFFGDVSQCDIGCPTDTDCKGGKTKCAFYVALYSDPPSPEMVCPHCKGSGQFRVDVSIRRHVSGMSDVISCAYCHGTGKVPSPEPLEKVSIGTIPYLKEFREIIIKIQDETAKAQILKLQQAGWGDLKEAQAEYLAKFTAYRDEEGKLMSMVKAEARQQAQGELSGWIRCPHCGSGAIIWGKDRILLECTNCGNKLQELPKE